MIWSSVGRLLCDIVVGSVCGHQNWSTKLWSSSKEIWLYVYVCCCRRRRPACVSASICRIAIFKQVHLISEVRIPFWAIERWDNIIFFELITPYSYNLTSMLEHSGRASPWNLTWLTWKIHWKKLVYENMMWAHAS